MTDEIMLDIKFVMVVGLRICKTNLRRNPPLHGRSSQLKMQLIQ